MRPRYTVEVNPYKGINGSYLLGYFTGDGAIRKVSTRVDGSSTYEVYITSGDKDLLEEMSEEYKGDSKIQKIRNGKLQRYYARLSTYNRNVSEYLLELGFEQKNKRGSNVFCNLNTQEKWKFIRGLFDSDGTVCQSGYLNKDGTVRISAQASILVFEELAKHVSKFLACQGICYKLRSRKTQEGYYLITIYIKGKSTWDFRDKIYQDCGFYIKRKRVRLEYDKKKMSLEEAISLNMNIRGISKMLDPETRVKDYTRRKIEGTL